jgi:hypothetical protein
MDTLLGLFGVAVFVVAIVALSAALTYAVVRLTPSRRGKGEQSAE